MLQPTVQVFNCPLAASLICSCIPCISKPTVHAKRPLRDHPLCSPVHFADIVESRQRLPSQKSHLCHPWQWRRSPPCFSTSLIALPLSVRWAGSPPPGQPGGGAVQPGWMVAVPSGTVAVIRFARYSSSSNQPRAACRRERRRLPRSCATTRPRSSPAYRFKVEVSGEQVEGVILGQVEPVDQAAGRPQQLVVTALDAAYGWIALRQPHPGRAQSGDGRARVSFKALPSSGPVRGLDWARLG